MIALLEKFGMIFEIKDEAESAIDAIKQITSRNKPIDVVIDALRIYEWILQKQAKGATIVAEFSDEFRENLHAENVELVSYIKDSVAAKEYFKNRAG